MFFVRIMILMVSLLLGLVVLIRLLLAGSREFTDRIQKQAGNHPDIRIISQATEPSHAVEAIENNVNNMEVVLLGFPDAEIMLMIDIATRHEVQGIIFISVENLPLAYRKWAKHKCKLARQGHELNTIVNYFAERPELLHDKNYANSYDIIPSADEPVIDNGYLKAQKNARVDEVRRRERSIRAMDIKKQTVTTVNTVSTISTILKSASQSLKLSLTTNNELDRTFVVSVPAGWVTTIGAVCARLVKL